MNISRLQAGIEQTNDRWNREASIAACQAIQAGRKARLVVYPTGLKMMRFAEPFTGNGMHYEVHLNVWNQLVADGGKIK